jgi:hypothetical protein
MSMDNVCDEFYNRLLHISEIDDILKETLLEGNSTS